MEPKNCLRMKRKIIFQTFTIVFHVNFPGCIMHQDRYFKDVCQQTSSPAWKAVCPQRLLAGEEHRSMWSIEAVWFRDVQGSIEICLLNSRIFRCKLTFLHAFGL